MSTLTSESTREEVLAAMADNASYDEDNSLSKAKAFRTACRIWLTRFAFKRTRTGQSELEMPPEMVQSQLQAATSWIASQPPEVVEGASGSVVRLSVEDFRR